MAMIDLDTWLPRPQVRTHHRREATAPADVLWDEASRIRLSDARRLGPVVRWRIPGLPEHLTFGELFRGPPFTVIGEGDGWLASGLCGRLWTLQRDYPELAGPSEFAGWDKPGTVRVLFAHWVEPAGPGRTALVSEGRVQPVDRGARLRLAALWAMIGMFERLIGAEPLELAVRRAERD
jgi:hypothetical protein